MRTLTRTSDVRAISVLCVPLWALVTLLCLAPLFPGGEARAEAKYKRSVERYQVPDLWLINQDGKKVNLKALCETGKPVVVDFIYGTCTTICPVLSAGFSSFQKRLGDKANQVQLVSITIDPEHDTPKVMKDYLARYRAKPGWDFLTGSRADIDRVMKAFNAYIPDKMSHYPINLIRSPKDGSWVRLFGLLSTREFMEEYNLVTGR